MSETATNLIEFRYNGTLNTDDGQKEVQGGIPIVHIYSHTTTWSWVSGGNTSDAYSTYQYELFTKLNSAPDYANIYIKNIEYDRSVCNGANVYFSTIPNNYIIGNTYVSIPYWALGVEASDYLTIAHGTNTFQNEFSALATEDYTTSVHGTLNWWFEHGWGNWLHANYTYDYYITLYDRPTLRSRTGYTLTYDSTNGFKYSIDYYDPEGLKNFTKTLGNSEKSVSFNISNSNSAGVTGTNATLDGLWSFCDRYKITVAKHAKPSIEKTTYTVSGTLYPAIIVKIPKTMQNGIRLYLNGSVYKTLSQDTVLNGINFYNSNIGTYDDDTYYKALFVIQDSINMRSYWNAQVVESDTLDITSKVYGFTSDINAGVYTNLQTGTVYLPSEKSDSVYSYILGTFDEKNVTVKVTGFNQRQASWTKLSNADGYKVMLVRTDLDSGWGSVSNATEIADIKSNSYIFNTLEKGNYIVNILPYSSESSNYYAVCSNTASDNTKFTVDRLEAPTITITGERLYWSDYDTVNNYGAVFAVYDTYAGNTYYLNTVSTTYYTLDTPTVRQEPGTHEFQVKAIALDSSGTELTEWSSTLSNVITVGVNTLPAPIISFEQTNNSIVVWDAIDHALYYDLYVDDSIVSEDLSTSLDNSTKRNTSPITGTSFDGLESLLGNTPGWYAIKVKAMSNELEWEDSPKSNVIFYKVAKITTPSNVAISTSGVLSWDAVTANWLTSSNSITYDIYVNDMYEASTTDTSYSLELVAGNSYSVYIQARETTQLSSNANPKFLISDASDPVGFGKLSTPVNLRAGADGYLRWDSVDNAKEYSVLNAGELISVTENTYYKIPNIQPGVYNFTVKANGWGNLVTSDSSANLIVYVIKLASPSIYLDDYVINWNVIPYAESYDIYLNGFKVANTANSYFDMEALLSTKGGNNQIYIKAVHTSELIIDSDRSNIVNKQVSVSYSYYAKIKENGIWSDPIDIEMPMTITDKYDDSLNTATITLVQNSRKAPYQAYTDVNISFNSYDGNAPYEERYYIISSDTVNERPRGNKRAYSHTLNLIERTRFLQTVMLPNISITQPQSFVYNSWASKGNIITPDLGGNYILSGVVNSGYSADTQNFLEDMGIGGLIGAGIGAGFAVGSAIGGWVGAIVGTILGLAVGVGATFVPQDLHSMGLNLFNNTSPENDVLANIESTTEFYLPFMDTKYVSAWRQEDKMNAYGHIYSSSRKDVKDSYITQRWYIRKHNATRSDQYTKFDDTPEYQIASYNSETDTSLPTFKFSDSEYYMNNKDNDAWDLILEIDDIAEGLYEFKDTGIYNFGTSMSDGEWAYDWYKNTLKLMSSSDMPGDRKVIPDKHFRVVYSGIHTQYTTTTISTESTIYVSDALNKICDTVNLLKINESAKYSIDPSIIARTSTMPIYQLKFEGKSMYEALDTIGKEFLGIPYLVDDTDVISFRIRDEKTTYILIDDTHEPKTEASSIDNNSTGFICDASNIISKENYEVYPYNGMWMTPRSTDESTAYVTTTNCGLVIDKPIAYLKKLEVTNYDDFGNKTDITAYCYEKTLYDALDADNDGKGKAIYWQIGSNKIYGLGILEKYYDEGNAACTWLGNALGFSAEDYAITNILYDKVGVQLDTSKVKDLQFRITYIPYNDARVVFEQFNTSEYQNYSYKAYNQTEGTIVDTSFGSTANKALERLGNNTITKQYKIAAGLTTINAGDLVLIDNEKYYVDTISSEYKNSYKVVTCDFTKNSNKINQRMGVDSEYRQYEIYNTDYTERYLNINHYCYLSTSEDYSSNEANKTANWPLIIKDCLEGNPHDSLQNFYVNVYGKGSANPTETLTYTDYNGDTQPIDYGFAIHATRLTPRNSVMYVGKMYDNYAAGYFSNKNNTYEGKYENKAIRYVDDLGQVYAIDLALGNPTMSQLFKNDSNGNASYYYPRCTRIASPGNSNINDCVTTNTYYVNKDNREALAFAYQMHFKSEEPKFYLHQGLTKYMFISPNEDTSTLRKPIIVGYKGAINTKEFYSYTSNDILKSSIDVGTTSHGTTYIKTFTVKVNSGYDGFALIYPTTPCGNGLILFDYKIAMDNGETYTIPNIYFNLKDELVEK